MFPKDIRDVVTPGDRQKPQTLRSADEEVVESGNHYRGPKEGESGRGRVRFLFPA